METIMDIKQCKTLDEVREEIDKVDDKIVEFIALRNEYVKQIANFQASIEEIKSPERISAVISRLRARAIELDLSPNLINDIFLRLIDEMVEEEIIDLKSVKSF
jgi:isochorismate pyruvate lyase